MRKTLLIFTCTALLLTSCNFITNRNLGNCVVIEKKGTDPVNEMKLVTPAGDTISLNKNNTEHFLRLDTEVGGELTVLKDIFFDNYQAIKIKS